jgi:hypothetical protein
MTHRVKRPVAVQWAGVPTREMCAYIGVSTDTLKDWRVRGLLRQGIHWYTMPGSPNIIWIKDLVRDFLANSGEPDAHKRAIERYLASLPSSEHYKPTA